MLGLAWLCLELTLAQARLQLASRLPRTGVDCFVTVNGIMLAAVLHCSDNIFGTAFATSGFLLCNIGTAADISILSSRVVQCVPM